MGDHLLLKNGSRLDLGTGTLLVRGASDPDPDSGGLVRLRSPKPTNEVNWDDPLNKGLTAWYPFKQNGGNVLRDIAGDNHGTLVGSMTSDDWVASPETNSLALDFDGADDYVDLSKRLMLGDGEFSLSVWFRSTSSAAHTIISDYQTTNGKWIAVELNGDLNGGADVGAVRWGIDDGTTKKITTFTSSRSFNDGEWHQALIARVNGADALSTYVDGEYVGGATGASSYGDISSSNPPTIGKTPVADVNYYSGNIGDIRLYRRALSESEVHDLYVASRTGYVDQFKRRSFPVGVTPTPTESHPSNGLIRLRQNAQPSYKAGYAKSASESAYPELWDGLVGSWMPSFGATGGTLLDVSGKRNGGTLTNMELDSDWVVSEKGIAINFDGTNEYIDDIGGVADYSFVQNTLSFAIAFTFKVTELGTRDVIWGNTGSSTEKGFFTQVTTDGEYWFNAFNSVGESTADRTVISVKSATGKIAAGQWHTAIVVGYPIGNSAKVFIDGIESTVIVNSHSGYSTGNSSRTLNIGRTNYTSNADNMIGQFTQFAIWDRPLGESEIQTITADPLAPFRQRRSIPFGVTAAPAVGFNHWYARQARTHRIVGSGVHV